MSDEQYTKTTADVALSQRNALDRLSATTRAAVERAGIVLVPDEGFRDYDRPVFPQGTIDFLGFLREHAPNGTEVVIAAEDASYREVVLHSDIVRLATVFVEYVAAPIAMSLIAAYLKDFLGRRLARAEARASIIVHRKDGTVEQTVRISYEGPAEHLEQTMMYAIATLPTKTDATPQKTAPQPTKPTQLARNKRTKRGK
jgi:hypothetical protein